MIYTTRPLSDRTWLRPDAARKRSQFDSTWSDTLELLAREIKHLGGRDVVIEVDVREHDIRNDGMLRSNARTPEHPAVLVAFESRDHGPMLHRCDKFERSYRTESIAWQENVRAVAKRLEALRAVDRYGATESGEQYVGFKALPAGRAMPASHMTSDEAMVVLRRVSRISSADVSAGPLFRRARAIAHPDHNDGDRTAWDQVEAAARVLGVAG